MKLIGLTGGIASGKSTAAAKLETLGASVIDADQIAREVVLPPSPALVRIAEAFGSEVFDRDGVLDRRALGRIVFADVEARQTLNGILHPAISQRMQDRLAWLRQNQTRVGVLMVPLLLEGGMNAMTDEIWVVYVDPETQLSRLIARDRSSVEEAQDRIRSQMPLKEKAALADVVIDNNGSIEEMLAQVEQAWRERC